MTTYNAENERVKRRYFTFQREAKQRGEASIDAIAKALNRFEGYTRFKSFRAFRIEQAKKKFCKMRGKSAQNFPRLFQRIFSQLAMIYGPLWLSGSRFSNKSGFGGSTIRFFPRRGWQLVRADISKPLAWIGSVGQTPRRFERFSELLSTLLILLVPQEGFEPQTPSLRMLS